MIPLVLVGCREDAGPERGDEAEPPLAQLARLSLDLRGVRPTVAEIEEVRAEGDLDAFVDRFLADDRWEGRVREAWQRVLRTRSETYRVFDALALDDPDAFVASVGEEPLRLVGRIAAEDRPYSELLTADWTVVDEHLAQTWRTDYPADATGWQVARYLDGRPAAGLLSTNGFFWRYPSTASNKNRKRANQASRVFACSDFLTNPVPFDPDVDLLDEEALENAIATNPSCTACHVDLDPLASHFYGFWYFYDDGFHTADASVYHPEQERDWVDHGGVAPAWFGAATAGLPSLPARIVADERFLPCAAQEAFRGLVGRDPGPEDDLDAHVRAFADAGFTIRGLWRSVVHDPAYVGAPPKVTPPDVLADEVEDLTGYRMTRPRGEDVLTTDQRGLLTLGGGADGEVVVEPLTTPTPTAVLVQERLASQAAAYVVASDRALAPAQRRLLGRATFAEVPGVDDAASAAQIRDLFLRVQTRDVPVDGVEVHAMQELYAEVFELDGGAEAAWGAVIAAMLRSPDFVAY